MSKSGREQNRDVLYPKRRVPALSNRVLDILKHHNLIKRLPGTIEEGISFFTFRRVLGLWTKEETISLSEAWRRVRDQIGKEDAKILHEISDLFNPTTFLAELIPLYLNDHDLLKQLKANSELCTHIGILAKKLA
jgi:hypothetical protein